MKFDLFDPGIISDPYLIYSILHAHGVRVIRGSPPMPEFPECWYVLGYNEALQILRSPVFVHDRGKITGLPPLSAFSGDALMFWEQITEWPLFLDAPEHTAKRQAFGSFFKEASILNLAGFIENESNTLLDLVLGKSSFDFMHDYSYPLSLHVICHLIGIKPPELGWFKSATGRLADTMDLRCGTHDYQPSLEAVAELNEFFMHELRNPSPHGLLAYLIAKGFSEEELLPLLIQIIFAGQETTADAMGLGMITLSKHPSSCQKLINEPQCMESFVREILRYDSSLQFSGIRTATENIDIGGAQITRGDSLVIALGACNYDPQHFPDPRIFNIERKDVGPEISFGHGIHHCLGVHLARLEMRIAFETLLKKLPVTWKLEAFELRQNRLFRGPQTLTIRLS